MESLYVTGVSSQRPSWKTTAPYEAGVIFQPPEAAAGILREVLITCAELQTVICSNYIIKINKKNTNISSNLSVDEDLYHFCLVQAGTFSNFSLFVHNQAKHEEYEGERSIN